MGVRLGDESLASFAKYLSLLQLWGGKINLTTRLEGREIVVHHFLDSLSGAAMLSARPETRVVDLGSGAGLPSIPLKIAIPQLEVTLVESVRKKVAFCQQVIRETGLLQIQALWGRGEELGRQPAHRGSYDWAVSRALGDSSDVVELALPFLAPGGRVLVYKGSPGTGEVERLAELCTSIGASWKLHSVTVPHLGALRSLIVVQTAV